ncbi:MAG TPA: electron transfer flavoprotein subunit beta, partial [Desulfobacterales bacterium]|nr:electron transfer flavoprotein subunit beta [Desulfobacterales bacterium]
MNIIVCLKQVPDTETQIKIAPDGKSIVQDDIKWIMNPYDEFGVEEALRIKEKFGGEVTVVGLGPKRVTETIRTALAMGADKGILITDDALQGSDSLAVAKALAAAIKDLQYDIIFTGQRGIDDDLGLVGA